MVWRGAEAMVGEQSRVNLPASLPLWGVWAELWRRWGGAAEWGPVLLPVHTILGTVLGTILSHHPPMMSSLSSLHLHPWPMTLIPLDILVMLL